MVALSAMAFLYCNRGPVSEVSVVRMPILLVSPLFLAHSFLDDHSRRPWGDSGIEV